MSTVQWKLKARDQPNKIIEISKSMFIIGRLPSADLLIMNTKVSRNHSRLFISRENVLFAEDCKSSNGTFVNGLKINPFEMKELANGDKLGFGISNGSKEDDDLCYDVIKEETVPLVSVCTAHGIDPPIVSEADSSSSAKSCVIHESNAPLRGFLSPTTSCKLGYNLNFDPPEPISNPKISLSKAITSDLQPAQFENVSSMCKEKQPSEFLNKGIVTIGTNNQILEEHMLTSSGMVEESSRRTTNRINKHNLDLDFSNMEEVNDVNVSVDSSNMDMDVDSTSHTIKGSVKPDSNNLVTKVSSQSVNLEFSVKIEKSKTSNSFQISNCNGKDSRTELPQLIKIKREQTRDTDTNRTDSNTSHQINKSKREQTRNTDTNRKDSNTSHQINKSKREQTRNTDTNREDSNTSYQNKSGYSKKDESFVIVSDDDGDDLFSCSQIHQFSDKIKTEKNVDDYDYMRIKSELCELDFCDREIIVNYVPFNLDDDQFGDLEPFGCTQDIMNCLASGFDEEVKNSNEVRNSNKSDIINTATNGVSKSSDSQKETDEKPKPYKTIGSSSQHHISSSHDNSSATTTRHQKKIYTKNDNKIQTPKQQKRSSVDPECVPKKKLKTNPSDIKCDTKSLQEELKKRNSRNKNQIGKKTCEDLKEERRKKLKEVANKAAIRKGAVEKLAVDESKSSKTKAKIKTSGGRGSFLLESDIPAKKSSNTINKCVSNNKINDPQKATSSTTNTDSNPNNIVGKGQPEYRLVPVDIKEAPQTKNIKNLTKSSQLCNSRKENQCFLNTGTTSSMVRSKSINSVFKTPPVPNDVKAGPFPSLLHNLGNTFHRKNERPINDKIHEVYVMDIVTRMVKWNPTWLEEQKQGVSECSPPVNDQPIKKVPLFFENFDDYANTLTPLITLELWQHIYEMSRCEQRPILHSSVVHHRVVGSLMYMDCELYLSEEEVKRGVYFRPEDFAIIECKVSDQKYVYASLNFALVKSCNRTYLKNEGLINPDIADRCQGIPHSRVNFTLATKYLNKELVQERGILLKVITNIGSYLRLFKTMRGIQSSPLCQYILKPKIDVFKFPPTHKELALQCSLNPEQKSIVLEASSLCTGKQSGIYCIKGPPGTGKSSVIVAIVMQILLSAGEKPLILLTAPSNAAIDGLVTKLIEYKRKLKDQYKRLIKLVRVGPESSVSENIKGYTLYELAFKHMALDYKEPFKNSNSRDLKAYVKDKLGSQFFTEIKKTEDVMLANSNIICTTLNSSPRLIDSVKRGKINFTCCIIDEATQCTEIESLLPTQLGLDKFVLVGDPKQLPATVCNMEARNHCYNQSLFSRIASNFKQDPRSPIKTLCEQYRMHSEICYFPNRYFYEGNLRSNPKWNQSIVPSIHPYLVFNILGTRTENSTNYINLDEVEMIRKLLLTLLENVDKNCKYSVGIITPYQAQKEIILKNIADINLPNGPVAVNTVDGFQGMENDIIIISCVRESTNNFLQNPNRLNVALTRAKQALYVIGNYTLFKDCKLLYDLREDAKRRRLCLDIKVKPQQLTNLSRYIMVK